MPTLASALAALLVLVTCAQARAAEPQRITLSIVGTSDLHGHLAALPWFAGYLRNLRAARDPGAVILLDAGDMFQGTLESNLSEGAPVIDAYNALGYSAVAIGNHEFDFGPAGPAPCPAQPGDDPQGALKARAAQAHFPVLVANLVRHGSRAPVSWRNVHPTTLLVADGIKVGIIGVLTTSAAHSTLPANIAGLDILPLPTTIAREAGRLRARGAKVVIAVAHEGGSCGSLADPDALESCDAHSEIFAVAEKLPKGSVDAIVAGHTHQALAQRVHGIPIIQAYANGRAFGRVDLTVDRESGKVVDSHLQRPQNICPSGRMDDCQPGDYLDRPVERDEQVAAIIAPAFAAVRQKGEERLGVEVTGPLPHMRSQETALGNLLADLMRTQAHSKEGAVPVAIINNGGMRAGLPVGPLTYGHLYEAFPFDNSFAFAKVRAATFRTLLARSLTHSDSLVSLSGLVARAHCQDKALVVALGRPDGTAIPDDAFLDLVTTDFLATGGDGFFTVGSLSFVIGVPMRDQMAATLRERGGKLGPRQLFDPDHPRLQLPGPVPLRCEP
jgi:2',3'-cyclic-nucleotide 2'-phosphodiesterase (5'-nucleotidase family)